MRLPDDPGYRRALEDARNSAIAIRDQMVALQIRLETDLDVNSALTSIQQ